MKIKLIIIGKTEEGYLSTGIEQYQARLNHYVPFEMVCISGLKNTKGLSVDQQKNKEGELLLKQVQPTDKLVLLDEKGKGYSSFEFSAYIQAQMNSGIKVLTFVVGGPYGFSDALYKRADYKVSLSQMTFSHQMVRLFFIEQLYRAMTILKGEPYHHV